MAISFIIAGTCREPPNRLAPRSLVATGAALVAAAAIRTFMQFGGPFGLAMFVVVLQGNISGATGGTRRRVPRDVLVGTGARRAVRRTGGVFARPTPTECRYSMTRIGFPDWKAAMSSTASR
jgi:hypothetical protein